MVDSSVCKQHNLGYVSCVLPSSLIPPHPYIGGQVSRVRVGNTFDYPCLGLHFARHVSGLRLLIAPWANGP
jgi:hypothetical protein